MRLLLCTDLDRTLLPNGTQAESRLARERFNHLVERPEVTLVYVSGRDKELVKKAIKHFQIPQPDYVIADVGSTIFQITGDDWHHWKSWDDAISADWQGKSYAQLHELLRDFSDLRLQPLHKQNTHKLSYYLPLYVQHDDLIKQIQRQLEKHQIRANLIWSVDEQANIGLLDILPESAGKYSAIAFLMQQLSFNLHETVFAGDSGNDISVMVSPLQSVLVANANEKVKQQAIIQAKQHQQLHSLYIAQGNCHGMNGNYSAGILEGVLHFMPEMAEWMGIEQEH